MFWYTIVVDKQKKLEGIAKEIELCKICKVGKSGKAVAGEGNANADIVFLGEAPGKQEALAGRPFVGRSGKLLRSLIRKIGLREENVYITSPVKYLPDRGTPSLSDITHGKIHLEKQLKVINPKIIVLLGATAAQAMLEKKVAIMKDHGKMFTQNGPSRLGRAEAERGYFLTLHPSAVLRFRKNLQPLEEDFEKLKEILLLRIRSGSE